MYSSTPSATRRSKRIQWAAGLATGFVIGLAGYGLLRLTHAATFAANKQAETATLSGNASVHSDATASAGSDVRFGSSTAPGGLPTGYTVTGNVIKDSNGAIYVPHGVARDTTQWSCYGNPVGGGTGIPASDFVTMRNVWKANIVRVALNQDYWLSGAAKYCKDYATTIATFVRNAHANGIRVILDLHWSDRGNLAVTGGGTAPKDANDQQCMADANSLTFWKQIAAVYKNDPNVWFELYNEPMMGQAAADWNIWKNGGYMGDSGCGFTAVGMQQMLDGIRGAGANNVVIATGSGWGAHLDGVPLLSGANVIYGIHPYANRGNSGAWSNNDWDNRFGNLAKQVPVIATEYGSFDCGASTYDQGILDFFRTRGVGYTGWSWIANGCNYPSLLSNADGTCAGGGCRTQADMKAFYSGAQKMTIPGIAGTVPSSF